MHNKLACFVSLGFIFNIISLAHSAVGLAVQNCDHTATSEFICLH